ncbi:RadC family protein [Sphaerobacter thermophilus]|jgi:DNA repair protein RadC|uniref:DNA repair protein RadC n=1 Tax=Sphaerobacter thermophilus (strain ATCC 49802 / DSM 20745 / KCCM 41009 / NCIMB 13125 / S 6022) TaxID=479434 RepID=D1C725_SPHTD|nr:DNA repair protein RadC [Sphaerobacter thermophilus]ACZ37786.1 DNA repair protein RadC [Sphaerobacter thermophilus DSM 20745]
MGADSRATYHLTMREMPADERPREKLRLRGAAALTNAELLAIILNTGVRGATVLDVATRLLVEHDGLPGLARLDFEDLRRSHGIGEAKAAKLKAALELGRRLTVAQPEDRPRVQTPEDIYAVAGSDMGALDQEQLRVVVLDTKNRVLRTVTLYQGSVNSAQVRVAEVFRDAVRLNAPAIAILHNHPSGDPTPSAADVALTAQLVQAAQLLGIDLLDHLIVGHNQFRSLRRMGLGFPAQRG